jgi:type II secretory pathway component PulL
MLREHFAAPVTTLPLVPPAAEVGMDLLPPSWRTQADQRRRWQRRRQQIVAAAAVYCLIVAGAWVHLAFLRRQSQQLETELRVLRPVLEQIQTKQARSTALAAALDPRRYGVELLYLIERQIPDGNVRLIEFDQTPTQWRLVGEAPSATLAVQYAARLKDDPELAACEINAGPPQLLAGERAQFSIFGKP